MLGKLIDWFLDDMLIERKVGSVRVTSNNGNIVNSDISMKRVPYWVAEKALRMASDVALHRVREGEAQSTITVTYYATGHYGFSPS